MRQLSHSSSFLPLSRVISATTTKLSLVHPPFSSSSTYLASAATLLRLRLKAALVSSLLLWMWRLFLQRTQCSIPQRKGSLRAR
ncbi:BnaC06g07110D [Brassica napus]|uniref:BnaC06g07110D protein n=1 Tax=Brassica napus TaxID=3708 RepID=A0A078H892_BRANA|nr:BnaC06g07110D [Brassica napus]